MDRLSKVAFFFVVILFVSFLLLFLFLAGGKALFLHAFSYQQFQLVSCLECSCNYRFFSLELTAFSNLSLQADYLPIKLPIKLGKMIHKSKKKKRAAFIFLLLYCSNSFSKPPITEGKASYLQLENKKQPKFLYKADIWTCLEDSIKRTC